MLGHYKGNWPAGRLGLSRLSKPVIEVSHHVVSALIYLILGREGVFQLKSKIFDDECDDA